MSVDDPSEPRAFYFGEPGAESFGWLHQPASRPEPATQLATQPSVGLVLCSSFGIEDLSLHRSLRHIASAVSEECGVPALRFDYTGTGDAADGPQGDQLASWVRSVHAAIDALREATGVQQVVLFGVRLGATLAALAAVDRTDVAACFAVAPVVRGRAYLRELKALQQATGSADEAAAVAGADGSFEAGGFVLNAQTQAALSAVDLTKLARAPAAQVTIVERDDLALPDKWPAALENQGAKVRCLSLPGYAAMVDRPDRTQVPEAISMALAELIQEFGAEAPAVLSQADQARPINSGQRQSLDLGGAQEQPVRVPGTALFGVLTSPAGQPAAASRGTVLMLNAGCIRRIGPSRLYVELARRWARQGWRVLRLDVSGIGDSSPQSGLRDNDPYAASAASDVVAALRYLQSLPDAAGPSVAVGLCSGSYHAFKAAVAGAAVQHAVMINPLTFFWKDGMSLDVDPASFERSFTDGSKWRKLLSGQVGLSTVASILGGRIRKRGSQMLRAMGRILGLRLQDDLAFELLAVARQGTPMHFVFSSTDPGENMLREGGGRVVAQLEQRGALSICRLDNADHIFTQLQARERLVRELDRLLGQRQPAAAPPG